MPESARERAWADFVLCRREPDVSPVVLDSWLRSRDLFHVDTALKRPPVLPEEEWRQRSERLDPLRVSSPVFERLADELRETRNMLALCDSDGYVLSTSGHPRVIEEVAEISLVAGGSWNERAAGTNGIGTALAAGHAVQVVGADHYVEAWQRWACTGAPIHDPVSGEILAVIDVTGYREEAQAHTLLAVRATAALVEQRLLLEFTLEEKLLGENLYARANRMPADALLAVNRRGDVVQVNAVAERLFAARPGSGGQFLCDDLKRVLRAVFERGGGHPEGYECVVDSPTTGTRMRIVALPVFRNRYPIGAIIVLPLGGPAPTRSSPSHRMREEEVALREQAVFEEILGHAAPLRAALASVWRVGPTDSTVLITGETGTGKELIAHAVHKCSRRSSRVFVSVNCAALPPSLIASELFGHEKGAFTGALQRRLGRFELADGGTIFLDEIGDLPADTQLALLRILQEREFERVGGTQSIRVDVRVIAATNRDLNAAMARGEFRSDLFYRLNVFPIAIPPLRERQEDIVPLAEFFVQRYARRAEKTIRGISEETGARLQAYPWPGNVRELQNVIERAVILCEGDALSVDPSWFGASDQNGGGTSERERIEAALMESKGRVSGPFGAANKLGIPRQTLDSRIAVLGIDKHQFRH